MIMTKSGPTRAGHHARPRAYPGPRMPRARPAASEQGQNRVMAFCSDAAQMESGHVSQNLSTERSAESDTD